VVCRIIAEERDVTRRGGSPEAGGDITIQDLETSSLRCEELLTNFLDGFEVVDDDRVEVGMKRKEVLGGGRKYHGSSLAPQPVCSFQLQ
jgi:hypothetical protein